MKSSLRKSTRPAKDVRFSSAQTDIAPPKGTSFEEHLLALIDLQRKTIEMERDVIVSERRAWDEERTCLTSRISKLEAMLDDSRVQVATAAAPTVDSGTTTITIPWDKLQNNKSSNRSHKREKSIHDDQPLSLTTVRSDARRALPPQQKPDHRAALRLKLSELGPPDKNRTMDAGHTPMAVVDEAGIHEGDNANDGEEAQLLPREASDSYFPDLPEDPSLKGPLSLLNDEEHDSGFLKELNEKLLDEARHEQGQGQGQNQDQDQDQNQNQNTLPGGPRNKEQDKGQGQGQSKGQDKEQNNVPGQDDELELKLKSTTNFGTAFGESNCGRC